MQYPFFGATNNPNNASVQWINPLGGTWNATDNNRQFIAPFDCTLSALTVRAATDPVSGTFVFVVRKEQVDTAMTVTFTGGVGSYPQVQTDSANTVSLSKGDRFNIQQTPTGTPTSGNYSIGLVMTETAGKAPIFSASNGAFTAATTSYLPFFGEGNAGLTYSNSFTIMPTSGTVDNLGFKLSAASTAYTATLYVNSSPTALTITCTGTTATYDTTHSVSVSAGDTIAWQVAAGGTNVRAYISATFTPTVPGEAISSISNTQTIVQNVTNYISHGVSGAVLGWNATESNRIAATPLAFTAKNLYVRVPAFTSGQTFASMFRVNSGTTSLTTTVTGDGTNPSTGSNTTEVPVAVNDTVAMRGITSATSGSLNTAISYVIYNPQISGGTALLMGV